MALAPMLTLTDRAAEQVKKLMAKSDTPVTGVRVGVKKGGCSGFMYEVEYATEKKQFEEVVEDKGVKIFIAPTAVMFLLGSEMDYRSSKFESGFVFSNPNAADLCGCGESFRFEQPQGTTTASLK